MMVLKLMSLGRGASGVGGKSVALIEAMLTAGVLPVIPAQGSVGASGDLAPLAHMAAVMIGAGEAFHQGERMAGGEALARAGLNPSSLGPKEGLALINGTQFSTALALAGLFEAERALQAAIVTGALSTDAIMGSTAPFARASTPARPAAARSPWRQPCARCSTARRSAKATATATPACRTPTASAASRRCRRGLDLLRQAARTLEIEANAVTDNPLVICRTARSCRAAISTPNRWPSPPTRSRWPWPRSGRSRSAGSR
jgi:histidine ammonia-lyase